MHRIIVSFVIASVFAGVAALFAQEPAAYILAKVTITDQDAYGEYREGFGEVFAQYGGNVLAVSSDPTVLEGEWEATTTVIIQFESQEEALAWYNSDGYQALVRIRQSASTADFILMEGRP